LNEIFSSYYRDVSLFKSRENERKKKNNYTLNIFSISNPENSRFKKDFPNIYENNDNEYQLKSSIIIRKEHFLLFNFKK